jgi:hypothetical protein
MLESKPKPPLSFRPSPENIPIVGQPFLIKGWYPTVLLVCNCEAREALMLPRGAAVQCPGCKRLYTIQQILAPAGVQFGIGVMTAEDAAPGAAEEQRNG